MYICIYSQEMMVKVARPPTKKGGKAAVGKTRGLPFLFPKRGGRGTNLEGSGTNRPFVGAFAVCESL